MAARHHACNASISGAEWVRWRATSISMKTEIVTTFAVSNEFYYFLVPNQFAFISTQQLRRTCDFRVAELVHRLIYRNEWSFKLECSSFHFHLLRVNSPSIKANKQFRWQWHRQSSKKKVEMNYINGWREGIGIGMQSWLQVHSLNVIDVRSSIRPRTDSNEINNK